MPSLVRKLLIVAAAEGLLLHPQHPKGQRPLQINYGSGNLVAYQQNLPREAASLEAHGVVGLLTVARSSFLIGITGRKQVAQVRGKPIYVITGVALIPVSSQRDASKAIEQAKRKENRAEDDTDSEDSDDYAHEEHHRDGSEIQTPALELEQTMSSEIKSRDDSTVAEDVITRKGKYGRFAERWFSRAGWKKDDRRIQAVGDTPKPAELSNHTIKDEAIAEGLLEGYTLMPLLPKLLRTARMLLGSQSFFFSYDFDITRRLGTQEPDNDVPLHKRVDNSYFWNRHLLVPFMEQSRGHGLALPVMQGFIGQKAFSVIIQSNSIANVKEDVGEIIEMQDNASQSDSFHAAPGAKDFLITLISRRSVKRPGLRYLRRGIDEDGNVANYVETEQILSDPSWLPSSTTYSFTQIRGSIPLFFSQSPYSLKPVPILHHSFDVNAAAFNKHFEKVTAEYGGVQIACLVDKHGTEFKVGHEFESHADRFNQNNESHPIGWNWFDFHGICRGMKFENVSLLLDEIGPTLENFGVTTERDGKVVNRQRGVLRVNCMDCLDRTNVVESAAAGRAVEQQLSAEGIEVNIQTDASTSWFNNLWADNGDAISKQYSSTAALKGDFTRTRKRDYRGAINDFGLTLSRYYNNIVNDYFSQASIDFLLGYVGDDVFDEFEQNMTTSDPAEMLSMRRIRQNAVDNSAKIVIANEAEDLIAGWTLLSPRIPNNVLVAGAGMEEVVLLLTDSALYAVRFDWTTEKVAGFERIGFEKIKSITMGAYISSILTASQCDSKRNVGFVIRYIPGEEADKKFNTRSMSTSAVPRLNDFAGDAQKEGERQQRINEHSTAAHGKDDGRSGARSRLEDETPSSEHVLAFKALPSKTPGEATEGTTTPVISEVDMIKGIVDDVSRAAKTTVDERDVVSLSEARKSTTLLEQWGHQLKMFVWGS